MQRGGGSSSSCSSLSTEQVTNVLCAREVTFYHPSRQPEGVDAERPAGWSSPPCGSGRLVQWYPCYPTTIWQSAGASMPSVIVRGPAAGTSRKVATRTVTPSLGLKAVWTLPWPGSTKAVPAK